MLQHATSVIGPPGTAMPSPGRDLVAELRREVKSLEERNRELHRELIEAKRASIRVVELEGKVAQLEDELADKVQATRQTIIAIEKGNYVPSVLLALRLAAILNKKVEEIFKYEKI